MIVRELLDRINICLQKGVINDTDLVSVAIMEKGKAWVTFPVSTIIAPTVVGEYSGNDYKDIQIMFFKEN